MSADSEIIGWTLSAFAGAAAVGGLGSGVASRHLPRERVVVGTLLLSVVALQGVLRELNGKRTAQNRFKVGFPPHQTAELVVGMAPEDTVSR